MQRIKLPKTVAAAALVVAAFGAAPAANAGIGVPQRHADIIAVVEHPDRARAQKHPDIIGVLKLVQMRKAGGEH